MSKKLVLVGILLLLLSSAVYGVDDFDEYGAKDLWVWAEVSEDLPFEIGDIILVEVYMMPITTTTMADLTLTLVPGGGGNAVKFIGKATKSPSVGLSLSSIVTVLANGKGTLPGTGWITIGFSEKSVGVNSRLPMHLASLQMEVKGPGPFQIDLIKDSPESSAKYIGAGGSLISYHLRQGNTRVIRNSHCVPKTVSACTQPNVECGITIINDGCGGKIGCSYPNTCVTGEVCIDNACVTAAEKALPVDASEYDKTLLGKMVTALGGANKDLKFAGIINAIVAWFNSPSNQ